MPRFKSKTLNKLRRLLTTLPKSRLNTFVWKIVPLSILSGLLDIGLVALSSRLAGSLVGKELNDLVGDEKCNCTIRKGLVNWTGRFDCPSQQEICDKGEKLLPLL